MYLPLKTSKISQKVSTLVTAITTIKFVVIAVTKIDTFCAIYDVRNGKYMFDNVVGYWYLGPLFSYRLSEGFEKENFIPTFGIGVGIKENLCTCIRRHFFKIDLVLHGSPHSFWTGVFSAF